MTTLEKQLIAISAHGIWIENAHGHRWIMCSEEATENGYNFNEQLKKHQISINGKIYGGVVQAVQVIDKAYKQMHNISLEQWFNYAYSDEYDITGRCDSVETLVNKASAEFGGGLY
jgi:hypothetical protein